MVFCKLQITTAVFSLIILSCCDIFSSATKLNTLPVDIAKEMMECAKDAAQSTTNERFGSKGEADARKIKWKDHAANFKKLSDGILKKSTCSDIQYMFWYQAWRTANERKGYSTTSDKKKISSYYNKIKKSGDLTSSLAANIKSMGGNIAWYYANKIYGYDDDAKRDKANYKSAYNKIHGEVTLKEMKFFINQADVKTEKPIVIAEQNLINNGDIDQMMEFSFEVTEGSTSEISHEFGFTYGVTTGLTVGFGGAEGSMEVSFEISATLSLTESLSVGTAKTYRFPLSVPGQSTYKAVGTVTEVELDVPYELVFDFEGVEKSFFGTWKGVAVSNVNSQIDDITPSTQAPATEKKKTPSTSWSWSRWGRRG